MNVEQRKHANWSLSGVVMSLFLFCAGCAEEGLLTKKDKQPEAESSPIVDVCARTRGFTVQERKQQKMNCPPEEDAKE